MKILFTGGSSFTGYHFISELSKNKKYKIFCSLQKKINTYKGIRYERIKLLSKIKNIVLLEQINFGDKKFIKILKKNNFKVICLHHSHTKNYNSDKNFNLKKSINRNLFNIDKVFRNLNKKTLLVVSNTVFQDIKLKKYKAVNNYGVSKTIFYNEIKKFCNLYKINFKSVYITNPWGIFEEKKLNFNMINCWVKNKEFILQYPNYIRDNIYINKLRREYSALIKDKSKKIEYFPSGYCSSNKVFVEAFRKKFEKYFKIKAHIKYLHSSKHDQPIKRINGLKINKKIIIKENLNSYFSYYKKKSFKS